MKGLNPCFNGIWSRTTASLGAIDVVVKVLILVLMEYGLGPYNVAEQKSMLTVLILVLMEYGLGLLLVLRTMIPQLTRS